jgi:SAM-dependent methyltransferase
MQVAGVPDASYDPYLKGFAYGWLQSILCFSPGAKILDVGCSATPHFAEKLRKAYGVEAHGLDKSTPTSKADWGLDEKSVQLYPELVLHNGFAGEEVCPAEFFDAVLSVSTLEHIYDHSKAVSSSEMYPHYRALKDMARMVKPGGILAFTYDFPLCYPYNAGWSPQADHEFLLTQGLLPLFPNKGPKSETFIYNHTDSLFVQADGILSYCDYYFRIVIICFAFFKPGQTQALVTYHPNCRIAHILEGGPEEYSQGPLLAPAPSLQPLAESRLRAALKRVIPKPIRHELRKIKRRVFRN